MGAKVYEDDVGVVRCGACGADLWRDEHGDMPEKCPRCRSWLDWYHFIFEDNEKQTAEAQKCETCKWFAEYEGVCCNGESDARGDFVEKSSMCERWEAHSKSEGSM